VRGINSLHGDKPTPTTNTSASPKTLVTYETTTGNSSVGMPMSQLATPMPQKCPGDVVDTDLQEAWKVLNSPSSWKTHSEKDEILKDLIGIKTYDELRLLDGDMKSLLFAKLKAIPAKTFQTCLKF
jgi:hypothetical protein